MAATRFSCQADQFEDGFVDLIERYADHQGADGQPPVGEDPKADHPIRTELAQVDGALRSVGRNAGELGNCRVGKHRDGCALLAGSPAFGEPTTIFGIAVTVIDHGERTDRLTWA